MKVSLFNLDVNCVLPQISVSNVLNYNEIPVEVFKMGVLDFDWCYYSDFLIH